MHETGLLYAAIAEVTEATGSWPVIRVSLAIGPDIDEQVADQAWRQASAGTTAEGATVTWSRSTHTLSCLHCGRLYHGDRLTRCTSCSGNGLVVVSAPEIELLGWATAPQAMAGLVPAAAESW